MHLVTAALAMVEDCLQAGDEPGDREDYGAFLPRVLREAIALGAWGEARAAYAMMTRCPMRHGSLEGFLDELCSVESIITRNAVERLDEQDAAGLQAFLALAAGFGAAAVEWLTRVMAESRQQRVRRAMAAAIAELCRDNPERLAPWLADPRWYVVRNVVNILGRIGGPAAAGMLRVASTHGEFRVRREVIAALTQVPPAQARPILLAMTRSTDTRTLCAVLHQLSNGPDPELARLLAQDLVEARFVERPAEEQRAILSALAAVAGDAALPVLEQELSKGGLFSRGLDGHRAAIARCIARIGTPSARAVLADGARSRNAAVRTRVRERAATGGRMSPLPRSGRAAARRRGPRARPRPAAGGALAACCVRRVSTTRPTTPSSAARRVAGALAGSPRTRPRWWAWASRSTSTACGCGRRRPAGADPRAAGGVPFRALGALRFLPGLRADELNAFLRLFVAARLRRAGRAAARDVRRGRRAAGDPGARPRPAIRRRRRDRRRRRAGARRARPRARGVPARGARHPERADADRAHRQAAAAPGAPPGAADGRQHHENEFSLVGLAAIKEHDEYTYAHCVNVSVVSIAIGQVLRLDRATLANLGVAALLHDIGKLAVPAEVLHKPGALSPEEWRSIQRHPLEGVKLVAQLPGLSTLMLDTMRVGFEHHLGLAGSGYPELPAPRVPGAFTRVVSVADVFDALTAHRAYRWRPFTGYEALRQLMNPGRVPYDPAVLWALVRCVGLYPAGTVLVTAAGHVALSLSPNPADPRRPFCRLLERPDGTRLDDPAATWEPMPPDQEVARVLSPEEWPGDVQKLLAA